MFVQVENLLILSYRLAIFSIPYGLVDVVSHRSALRLPLARPTEKEKETISPIFLLSPLCDSDMVSRFVPQANTTCAVFSQSEMQTVLEGVKDDL